MEMLNIKKYDKTIGANDPDNYVVYKDEPYFIYNGSFEKEKYYTRIEGPNNYVLQVNGLLHTYVLKNNFLYLLVAPMLKGEDGFDKCKMKLI
ncbi:MAG: hypothetical protein ACK5KQ_00730 [Anaerorhabdus sp.]